MEALRPLPAGQSAEPVRKSEGLGSRPASPGFTPARRSTLLYNEGAREQDIPF